MKCDECPLKLDTLMCEGEITHTICDGIKSKDKRYLALAKPVSSTISPSPPDTSVYTQAERTLGEKAITFGTSLVSFMQHGMPTVTPEQREERLRICYGCEFRGQDTQLNTREGKCLKCGCFLQLKTWWATEACPIKKWPNLVGPKPMYSTEGTETQIQPQPQAETESQSRKGCCGG